MGGRSGRGSRSRIGYASGYQNSYSDAEISLTRIPRQWYRQKNQRLARTATLLCVCAVSPCILHHFAAPCGTFWLSCVSNLAIAPGVTRTMRRHACMALSPQPTHAIPVPFTRQPLVGLTPKTRRRRCLPLAVVRPFRVVFDASEYHHRHWVLYLPHVFPHGTLFPKIVQYEGSRARWSQRHAAPLLRAE